MLTVMAPLTPKRWSRLAAPKQGCRTRRGQYPVWKRRESGWLHSVGHWPPGESRRSQRRWPPNRSRCRWHPCDDHLPALTTVAPV